MSIMPTSMIHKLTGQSLRSIVVTEGTKFVESRSSSSNNRSDDDVACIYFTFLHLVSYLTVNQQFGHEATESHSGQRQVMFENGQAF